MLNPDGSIKPEYAHLTIAKYLAEKAQEKKLKSDRDDLVQKMREYEENPTPELEAEIRALSEGLDSKGLQRVRSEIQTEFSDATTGAAVTTAEETADNTPSGFDAFGEMSGIKPV